MAIGRLDEASEGLLLLTTDGLVSEEVRSKEVEKEYWVQLDGIISQKAIHELEQGPTIKIEGRSHKCLPSKVFKIDTPLHLPKRRKPIRGEHHGPTSWISIIIKEGKFRQVRKMTAAAGFPTLRLIRVRVGNEELGNMEAGECKEVKEFHIKASMD